MLACFLSFASNKKQYSTLYVPEESVRSDYPLFFGLVEYPQHIFNSVSFLIRRPSTESGQYSPSSGCQLVA